MSLYCFVDTRNTSSLQSFKQNTHISAFHEYVLTMLSNYYNLHKQYACVPQLRSLFVCSSPTMVKMISVTSLTSLGVSLRPRFSCTGTPSSVVATTWNMMETALAVLVDKISPYERNDKV